MIAPTIIATILLVVGQVSSEQPQVEVSNFQPVPVVNHQPHSVISEHGVVSEVVPSGGGVVQPQQVAGAPLESPAANSRRHKQVGHQAAQYYSPSGVVQVVGAEQPVVSQYGAGGVVPPAGVPAGAEQYGQPESASIPPNYKPWGSWGLYIGGNPADGYYSSYYKALSQSVADKQQVGADSVKPGSPQAVVSQASGISAGSGSHQSSILRQGSFPYNYQDSGYPYDSYYTPADLNSGSRVSVVPQSAAAYPVAPAFSVSGSPSVYSSGSPSVYSSGSYSQGYGYEQPQVGPSYYAPAVDSYAGTKRIGQSAASSSSYGTKSVDQQQQQQVAFVKETQQQVPAKGYAQPQPIYSSNPRPVHYSYSSSVVAPQQQQQVVAYPVPVGSQIVGSQPGVDGAYAPFGVHGYTRYAIKPTVVSSPAAEPQPQYAHGVHSSPVSQFPVYKSGQVYGYQQPLSFYGYPLSQLHYSQGSISSPSVAGQASHSEYSSSSSSAASSGIQQPHFEHSSVASPVAPIVGAPLGMPAGIQYEAAASSNKEESVKPKESAAAATAAAANTK